MFFYPADISHFHTFGCHLGSQLGSLLQKCDLGRCDQNLHKSRLCFFTQQTFCMFIPLAVTWGSNLDPCGKSVILAGASKIHMKVLLCSFAQQTFPNFIPLAVAWDPNFDPCCKSVILAGAGEKYIKVIYVSLPSRHFLFHSFCCHLGSQLWSLLQKCDPDRCDQNSHKSRVCFSTHQTFPLFISFAVTWDPNLDPCGKSVILAVAMKIYIKIAYCFLPSKHFPFSFHWLSLRIPT